MKHFFKPTANQVLYHYTAVEGAEAILRTNTLRLSEFSTMNDKSEYAYAKSKFVEAYQNREVWVAEVSRFMLNITLNTHEPATVMELRYLRCGFSNDKVDMDPHASLNYPCGMRIRYPQSNR